MDFGESSYQEFFDKLRSTTGPNNLRRIFEDDQRGLQHESNSLRYQPQLQSPRIPQQQPQQSHNGRGDGTELAAGPGAATTESARTQSSGANAQGTPISTAHYIPEDAPRGSGSSAVHWTTVIAKVAYGFNGSDNVGRVGVALSRHMNTSAMKLIIYKSKQEVYGILRLIANDTSASRACVILRESYMQFYDDQQHFWSVRFDSHQDEKDFTKAMRLFGLLVEKVDTVRRSSSPHTISSSVSISLMTLTAAAEQVLGGSVTQDSGAQSQRPSLHRAGRGEAVSAATSVTESVSDTSENDDDDDVEDILVTPAAKAALSHSSSSQALVPVLSSSNSNANISLAVSSTNTSRNSAEKIEAYLDEQRASGQLMERKMDSILDAMKRLMSTHNAQEQVALSADETSTTIDMSEKDKEDELLDLEQKLLNFKKENRRLIKNLKAKEQALLDLRTSTCALCEDLLAQNNDLKKQNSTLLSTMNAHLHGKGINMNLQSRAPCTQCEQATAKIIMLERRVTALQNALLTCTSNFGNTGNTTKTTTTTTTTAATTATPSTIM
ncbi:uncharacterized protein LOC115629321 [Scaptodrosophila lebanonensis]|uniref:Uncharacterized protein LOC115629321 n=1 Tax=Drosophila lebanonensis TaxID=7225 RepID=A0A6J2U149_DROLE|nr:uncharacterized protein LOC115629321 [Scaptodrosophila lebanonensis]